MASKVKRYESGPRRGQPIDESSPTGRPLEGIADWDIDHSRYTEWALKARGYVPRREKEGWLTGFYHLNKKGIRVGGGSPHGHGDTKNLDEEGFNEVAFVPIGAQRTPHAESVWAAYFPALHAWYMDDNELRPYFHSAILFIKTDVYLHTQGTADGEGDPYENDEDDDES